MFSAAGPCELVFVIRSILSTRLFPPRNDLGIGHFWVRLNERFESIVRIAVANRRTRGGEAHQPTNIIKLEADAQELSWTRISSTVHSISRS
jgi:hypothetical protein